MEVLPGTLPWPEGGAWGKEAHLPARKHDPECGCLDRKYSPKPCFTLLRPSRTRGCITLSDRWHHYSSGGKRPSNRRFARSITRDGSLMFKTCTVTLPE